MVATFPVDPERPDAISTPPPNDDDNRIDPERLFDTYGITPLPLALGRAPHDLLRAYENWSDLLSQWLHLDAEPWLPVGSIGPLMILGHYLPPRKQPSLLPPWMSGRAMVQEDSYRKIAADLRESHAQALRHSYEAPRSRLPESAPQ